MFKHIITAFYKSFYDFKWITLQRGKMAYAFFYFFVLFFVVVGVRGWFFIQDIPTNIVAHWDMVETNLPEDFFVEKNDDGLSVIGVDQPYIQEFKEDNDTVLVYVDTVSTSSISIEEVLGTSTDRYVVLVTSKKLKFFDPHAKKTESEDVAQLPNFSFTKQQVGNEIAKLTERFLPGIFIVGVFFVTVFFGVGKLGYLVILSWLVYTVARADKKLWKFGQVFTIGLYALTIPILFQWGVQTFLPFSIPYIYTLLVGVMMFGVIYKGGAQEKSDTPGGQPPLPEPPTPPTPPVS